MRDVNPHKIKISVLTPTWNRANYLPSLFQGLVDQRYRHFEWLVGNDGSTDDTEVVLTDLINRADFPVTLITASCRTGKAVMDNLLIQHARGDYVVWNDSDDVLTPDALEVMVDAIARVSIADTTDFIGVTALAADECGVLLAGGSDLGEFDTTWNELGHKFEAYGDKTLLIKASVLKEHRFLEVDYVVPEGSLWSALGDLQTRFVPKVLKRVRYGASGSISFSNKLRYCRGYALAIVEGEKNAQNHTKRFRFRLRKLLMYSRYSLHGDISFTESARMWRGQRDFWLFLALYAPGWALSVLDQLRGKVEKTHLEFEEAVRDASYFMRNFADGVEVTAVSTSAL